MSRYDGLIIPRSYSEYINKTDAATLLQAMQLSGVMDAEPTNGNRKPITSDGVYNGLLKTVRLINTYPIERLTTTTIQLSANGAWLLAASSNYGGLIAFKNNGSSTNKGLTIINNSSMDIVVNQENSLWVDVTNTGNGTVTLRVFRI